jgi:hypothetical protein
MAANRAAIAKLLQPTLDEWCDLNDVERVELAVEPNVVGDDALAWTEYEPPRVVIAAEVIEGQPGLPSGSLGWGRLLDDLIAHEFTHIMTAHRRVHFKPTVAPIGGDPHGPLFCNTAFKIVGPLLGVRPPRYHDADAWHWPMCARPKGWYGTELRVALR